MKTTTQRRIGATDAAKLLGVSKYGSALDVYERIVLGKTTKPNAAMKRGTTMEPEVLRRYQVATGATLREQPSPFIVEHPDFMWATCSPDAVTFEGVLVEAKTASVWSKGWQGDMPPVDYVMQVQWALWVTGLPEGHLYACFGSDDRASGGFFIEREQMWTFRRDAELEQLFREEGERFWTQHVVPKIPPTAAPTNATEAA